MVVADPGNFDLGDFRPVYPSAAQLRRRIVVRREDESIRVNKINSKKAIQIPRELVASTGKVPH